MKMRKRQVAELIHGEPDEIVFTSSGSESDNHAIKGAAYSRKDRGIHIITASVEHPAVLNTCRYLETKGFEVTYLPVDGYGAVNPGDVKNALREDTILITVMYANNETGTLSPLKEIGEIAKRTRHSVPLGYGSGPGQSAGRCGRIQRGPCEFCGPQGVRTQRSGGPLHKERDRDRYSHSWRTSGVVTQERAPKI